MVKIINTFYSLILRFKAILLSVIILALPITNSAQSDIQTIVELNNKSESLTHNNPVEALANAEKALSLSLKIKNDSLEYASRFNRGIVNYFLGNQNSSLEDFIKNKELAKKLNKPKNIIETLNAIANVYKDIDRRDMSMRSYQEALDVCIKTHDFDKLTLIQSNIAILLGDLHLYDSSLVYCYNILKNPRIQQKTISRFIAGVYGIVLSNYIEKKITDSVSKYSEIVLNYQKNANDKYNYAGNLYNLGGFYFSVGDYKKAEERLSLARKINPENIELLIDINKDLGLTYSKLKNYEKSTEVFLECIGLKDSLYKIQTVDKLSEMEVKYETGKKEEELKRMSAEKEITDLKAKQSQIWLIVVSVGILFVVIIAITLYRQNKNRQEANKLLQNQNNEIIHQKKEITDSINYAKRIQLAILPPDKMVKKLLPTAFVMYKPKDVVSGDFYWIEEKNGVVLFASVDCTGHGVPGAMMSVVGLNLLNQAVKEKGLIIPSDILKHLDAGVTDTLRQSGDTDSIKDGMDLSLCSYNPKTLELQYAGAFNNLWIVRKNISSSYKLKNKFELFFEESLLEIKADKFPIGSNLDGVADNYTNHTLQLQKGDCIYLYSDGYADQFGGPKGKKFKYNALKKLLVSIHELPPEEQREKLLFAFESWRGNLEQIDDILVMGVCV